LDKPTAIFPTVLRCGDNGCRNTVDFWHSDG
jgi:hypothetical protein